MLDLDNLAELSINLAKPAYLLPLLAIYLLVRFLWNRRGSSRRVRNTRDKAIFITGCDTGIGHEAAKLFHRLGFVVFAGCFQTQSDGSRRLMQLGFTDQRLRVIPIDVRSQKSVEMAAQYVASNMPDDAGLWALINNAGVIVLGEFEWLTSEQMHRQIDVNLLGAMRTTKAFMPILKQSKFRGRVINITSPLTDQTIYGCMAYNVSQTALDTFTKCLRYEHPHLDFTQVRVGEYTTATSFLANQAKDFAYMWNSMYKPQQESNLHEFNAFASVVLNSRGSEATLQDSVLLDRLVTAVTDLSPGFVYDSVQGRVWLGATVLRLVPEFVKVKLVVRVKRFVIERRLRQMAKEDYIFPVE